MNCKKAEKWLADRELGLLSDANARSLEGHLALCSHCRQQAGQYSEAVRALQDHIPEYMTLNLSDRVMGHVQPQQRAGFFSVKWLMPAVMGATALLVAGVSPLLFTTQDSKMTRQEAFAACAEDLDYFGIGSTVQSTTTDFDFQTYGVPDTVSQYMN